MNHEYVISSFRWWNVHFMKSNTFPNRRLARWGPGALRWTSGSEPLRDGQGWGGDPEITWVVGIHGFFGSFWTWICWLAHFGKLHGWQPTNKLVVKDSKWMVGELFGTCVIDSFLDALRKEFRPCCKRTVLKKHQDLMKSSWLNPFLRLLAPFEKPGWVIYCHGTSCGGVSCQACCRAGYNRHDGVDRNQKSR